MEITLFAILVVISLIYTALTYSKNAHNTFNNLIISGMLWFVCALNSFELHYYIPIANSYIRLTDNSQYWQLELAVVFMALGVSQWMQYATDKREEREREIEGS